MMCLHSRISSDLDDHPLIIQMQSLRSLRAPDTATKAPPMRPCQTCLFKKLFQQNVHDKNIVIWIWPLFHSSLWRSWGRWLSYAENVIYVIGKFLCGRLIPLLTFTDFQRQQLRCYVTPIFVTGTMAFPHHHP